MKILEFLSACKITTKKKTKQTNKHEHYFITFLCVGGLCELFGKIFTIPQLDVS